MQRRTFLRGLGVGLAAAAVPSFALSSLEQRATAMKVDWGEITHRQTLSFVWDPETGKLDVVNRDRASHTVYGAILQVSDDPGAATVWLFDERGRAVPQAAAAHT